MSVCLWKPREHLPSLPCLGYHCVPQTVWAYLCEPVAWCGWWAGTPPPLPGLLTRLGAEKGVPLGVQAEPLAFTVWKPCMRNGAAHLPSQAVEAPRTQGRPPCWRLRISWQPGRVLEKTRSHLGQELVAPGSPWRPHAAQPRPPGPQPAAAHPPALPFVSSSSMVVWVLSDDSWGHTGRQQVSMWPPRACRCPPVTPWAGLELHTPRRSPDPKAHTPDG